MTIRDSQEYKSMDLFTACSVAENFDNEDQEEEMVRAAWQYLYDQKAYLWLQGWYGRTMRDLVEVGIIEP